MKLRNKKTGEIVKVESLYLTQTQELYLNYINEENKQKVYTTDKIASFNLDWEDYEEPKEKGYFIDIRAREIKVVADISLATSKRRSFQELGLYFDTREEAELAVRKLKAVKRLKDKGFRFTGFTHKDRGRLDELEIYCQLGERPEDIEDMEDVCLLFGDKE